MTAAPAGSAVVCAAVELLNRTLAPVALIAMVPVTSGVGSGVLGVAPADSATRKNPCGGIIPLSGVTCQAAPVELVYCTDQPARFTAVSSSLKSSIKSLE